MRDETKTEVDHTDFLVMFNLRLDKKYTLELLHAIRKQEQQQ